MKRILYFLMFGGAALLCSCHEFLERTPVNALGSNNFFTDESALKTYTNGFLQYLPDKATLAYGDGYCDIVCTRSSTTFLTTTLWSPAQQDGWSNSDWKPIYNVNYFLKHFRETPGVSEETFNHYEGTARFWRAWIYYDFVRKFGAVPWYDEPIDSDDESALYKPRDNREYVMDNILEDLNFACENVLATSAWTNSQLVSKYVCLALKARVCLFEGTYRKYHTVDPSTGQPWQDTSVSERFLRECVSACEELMNSGVYKLVDSGTDSGRQSQYRRLFTTETIDYTEIIWALEFNAAMNRCHDLTQLYTSGSAGQNWCLTQDFLQTYLHRDGKRHAEVIAERQAAGEDVTLTTEFFSDEVDCKGENGRDYRLMQQIITPGYTKSSGGQIIDFSPVFTTAFTGYQIIKWTLDDAQYETYTNSWNSLPIFRYAEVLLNYAEAKAELGEFTQDVWDKTIKLTRERAGVDGTRRTDIDQTLADYYQLTDCDLVEIRRERAIEMLLEDLRYDDLMRWHLGELLNVDWYGIYIPEKYVAYDIDGNGTLDVAVVDNSSEVLSGVNNIILNNGQYELENGDSGRLFYNIVRRFDEQRYLRPIPETAMNINPDLGQNYYWQ